MRCNSFIPELPQQLLVARRLVKLEGTRAAHWSNVHDPCIKLSSLVPGSRCWGMEKSLPWESAMIFLLATPHEEPAYPCETWTCTDPMLGLHF